MTGHTDDPENCPTTEIPDDNPFRDQIIDLRSDGHSWTEIWELLEDAYGPIDQAAYEEDFRKIPEWRARAVVYDHKSTSGEAYEEFSAAFETREEFVEWVEGRDDVIRVKENPIEKDGTVKVA